MSRCRKPAPAASGPAVLPVGVARSSQSLERLTCRLGEVAKSLGVSRQRLVRERSAGRFPKPDLTIGKAPLWRPATIREWIEPGGCP
jgi:predicted DNA-binding transcriptional regulator AlpA